MRTVRRIIAPFLFSMVKWQSRAVFDIFKSSFKKDPLQKQIEAFIKEEGFHFPPAFFKLSSAPRLLIISEREEILPLSYYLLEAGINDKTIQDIEDRIDRLGFSSYISPPIGGLASAPIILVNEEVTSLRRRVGIIFHEWTHEYLSFKLVGLLYAADLLKFIDFQKVRLLNEALADLIGQEFAEKFLLKYYPEAAEKNRQDENEFNRELGAVKNEAQRLLALGQVNEAEKFMEEKLPAILRIRSDVRKLNQASLAFWGAYQESTNPFSAKLKALRSESSSLKEFLGGASRTKNLRNLLKLAD